MTGTFESDMGGTFNVLQSCYCSLYVLLYIFLLSNVWKLKESHTFRYAIFFFDFYDDVSDKFSLIRRHSL